MLWHHKKKRINNIKILVLRYWDTWGHICIYMYLYCYIHICVWVYIYTHIWGVAVCGMCMYVCSLVLVCTETRQRCQVFFSIALCLILVRQDLSMNLKFAVSARLASHWTPGIHLIATPTCAHDQLFFLVTGSLNSGPHAYKASILTYWVSHFSSPPHPHFMILFFKDRISCSSCWPQIHLSFCSSMG